MLCLHPTTAAKGRVRSNKHCLTIDRISAHQDPKTAQAMRHAVINRNTAKALRNRGGEMVWASFAPKGAKAIVDGTITAKASRLA